MSIFVVVQQNVSGPKGTLASRINETLPNYQLSDGVWLVANVGTARETSEKLGIIGGETGSGVVAEISSYYGRANPAIWSWMKQNWERTALD